MASLAAVGAGASLSLPGVDEALPAAAYMRQVLEVGRERGLEFDQAWTLGFSRIQAPQTGGMINPLDAQLVREERSLLEECQPLWRANYERREPLALERARVHTRAWERLDG